MFRKNLFIIPVISVVFAQAQPASYNAELIPPEIKKKANVVKRYENIVFTVSKIDDATLDIHQVFTVLNEDGKSTLMFNVETNKYVSIDEAEIRVYDANGKQQSKYKKKDMTTQAVGEGLIEDGYVTYYMVNATSYPITVEFKYQIKQKGTLNIPAYRIISHEQGVEHSEFTARIPSDIGLRYLAKNTELKPKTSNDGKYSVYKWSVSNLPPFDYEEGAVSYSDRYPSVKLALNRFSIYGYDGDMSSWKNFGQWLSKLYIGLDVLSPDKVVFFKEMVKNAQSDREKARIIYDYLQKNFRYVSIQLGVGGYKPFPASFTDQKKYGDCKGLSNYMKAALTAVGVESHLAIINGGYNDEPVNPEFPSNDFNHVILCVPQDKDSIWLECTSSTSDFAELGTFTENRNALLITDQGGVLVATPKSRSEANKMFSRTTVQLAVDGSGLCETIFRSMGSIKEDMEEILKAKKDDQKEIFVYGLSYKQPDEFEFSKIESSDFHVSTLKMSVEKIPEFTTGTKIFLAPRIYKIWRRKLPSAENRRFDFYFRQPYQETDTTIYKLPEGYKVDVLPASKEFSCEFATYRSKHWYDEQQKAVISTVFLDLKQHRIPAGKYASVKKFFDDVMVNDTQRIVVKKE